MIVGLGTDIVEISRIGEMIERHADAFLNRIFTPEEIRYCQRHKEFSQHFAGRWAAKEAVMKALGTGFVKGISFKDVEVCKLKSGAPNIQLSGGARDCATQQGIVQVLITISHCRTFATATAIAVSQQQPIQ